MIGAEQDRRYALLGFWRLIARHQLVDRRHIGEFWIAFARALYQDADEAIFLPGDKRLAGRKDEGTPNGIALRLSRWRGLDRCRSCNR